MKASDIEERWKASEITGVPISMLINDEELYKKLTKEVKMREDYLTTAYNGYMSDNVNRTQAQIGMRMIYGEETEEMWEQIRALEEEGKKYEPPLLPGFVQEGLHGTTQMITQMIRGFNRGAPFALAVSGIAAFFGNTGPQALLPEEIVTVPTAASMGFAMGSTLENFEREAGGAMIEYAQMKDENGQTMDRNAARVAAIITGFANSWIENSQMDKIFESIPGLKEVVGKIGRPEMKELLKVPSIKGALAEIGKEYVGEITDEMAQEIAQEGVTVILGEVAKAISGQPFAKPDWKEVINRLKETGEQTAKTMSVMFLPGAAMKAVGVGINREQIQEMRNEALRKNAEIEAEQKQNSNMVEEETKGENGIVEEETPKGKEEEIVEDGAEEEKEQLNDTEIEEKEEGSNHVFIPKKVLEKYEQGEDILRELGIEAEAELENGDVMISRGDYEILEQEREDFIRENQKDIRFGATAMTMREVSEMMLKKSKQDPLWYSEETKQLHEYLIEQMTKAGRSKTEAIAFADIATLFAVSTSKKTGLGVWEVMNVAIQKAEEINSDISGESYNQVMGVKGAENLGEEIISKKEMGVKMHKEGEDPLNIKFASGWEFDVNDGKWKYEFMSGELNEKQIIKDKEKDTETFTHKLSEIYVSPILYEAYPELRDMTVTFRDDLPERTRGRYKGSNEGIEIRGSLDLEEMRGVLAHEVQHAIQQIEGFGEGGSSSGVKIIAGPIVKSLSKDIFNTVLHENPNATKKVKAALSMLANKLKNNEKSDTAIETIKETLKFNKDVTQAELNTFLNLAYMMRDIRERKERIIKKAKGMYEVKQAIGDSLRSFIEKNTRNKKFDTHVKRAKEISKQLYRAGYEGSYAQLSASSKASFSEIGTKLDNIEEYAEAGILLSDLSGLIRNTLSLAKPSNQAEPSGLSASGSSSGTSTAIGTNSLKKYWNTTETSENKNISKSLTQNAEIVNPENYNQGEGDINARILWPKDSSILGSQSLIEFFSNANKSSSFHELAHHMFRVMWELSDLDGVDPQLASDVEIILKSAGVSMEDYMLDNDDARRRAQEYFAKGFETYLSEGKAPTKELKAVFSRIRKWLIEIYHDVVQALGIELNDEMREVFDRLLMTPEQIDEKTKISDLAIEEAALKEELKRAEARLRELEEINSMYADMSEYYFPGISEDALNNVDGWLSEMAYYEDNSSDSNKDKKLAPLIEINTDTLNAFINRIGIEGTKNYIKERKKYLNKLMKATQNEVDKTRTDYDRAKSQLDNLQRQLKTSKGQENSSQLNAQIKEAQKNLNEKLAEVDVAEYDLKDIYQEQKEIRESIKALDRVLNAEDPDAEPLPKWLADFKDDKKSENKKQKQTLTISEAMKKGYQMAEKYSREAYKLGVKDEKSVGKERIEKLKEKYKGKLDELEIKRRLQLQSSKALASMNLKQRLKQLRQSYQNLIQAQNERRKIKEKFSRLVKSIERMAKTESISWGKQQEIKNFLENYDLKKRSKSFIEHQQYVAENLSQHQQAVNNFGLSNMNATMSADEMSFLGISSEDLEYFTNKTPLNEMTLDDLR